MKWVVAVALTSSATATWVAAVLYGHRIVNPALLYLGSILTAFAGFKWAVAFGDFHGDIELWFITGVQVGIVLIMVAGKRFHDQAEQRMAAWTAKHQLE